MVLKKLIVLTCALLLSSSVYAKKKAHWGYSGHGGAKNWAKLSKDNFACSGKNQSPVNLTGFIKASLSPIKFNYKKGGYQILNNGHTVQVNYKKGSNIKIYGKTFRLLQFHFHAPSENHINGHSYPLEAHLVHADKKGNLAVVAVMFKIGKANKGLTKAWSKMPKHAGNKHSISKMISVDDILPTSRKYYRFNGSLTTPPCSEGVRWFVMKNAITASKRQIASFSKVLHEPNNRPIQRINARTILR
ncbi:MAG: carbonic anhydrase [bacterium]|jgi:carbonic anhydrase